MNTADFYTQPEPPSQPQDVYVPDAPVAPEDNQPAVITPAIRAKFLPRIGVWIAVESRTAPHCWRVAEDGKWAGDFYVEQPDGSRALQHFPVKYVQEGRHEVEHVLAAAVTEEEALRRGREVKENLKP